MALAALAAGKTEEVTATLGKEATGEVRIGLEWVDAASEPAAMAAASAAAAAAEARSDAALGDEMVAVEAEAAGAKLRPRPLSIW